MIYVAEVIVDVPTMQTDTPYTYLIPPALGKYIKKGMRVEVPFGNGNRHVQGFVLNTVYYESMSDFSGYDMKKIVAILDLAPVLNDELLALADEIKEKTFSFKITCLQTMLPSVMKASYEKYLRLIDEVPDSISFEIFKGRDEIPWDEAVLSNRLPELMALRQEEKLEIRYEVKTKNKSKTAKAIHSRLTVESAEEIRESLSARAHQKVKLLNLLQQMSDETSILVTEAIKQHEISRATINAAEKQGWLELIDREIQRDPFAGKTIIKDQPQVLNPEQQVAYEAVKESVEAQQPDTFLLEGITGSGKTEVYLQVIASALKKNKTAIMLVPEISLTPQTANRFKSRFGDDVAVLHSGLSVGEKYDEWRKVERGEARVVVGARSAVFAPLDNVGVIVVDEEHEASYKQDDSPRYHARDVAIWRSHYHKCPVILGSATPSLETRARAQKGVYQFLTLTRRANQAAQLPTIDIVDLRDEMTLGKMQTFSKTLLDKLTDRLAKGEQSVLMLNRRGYSSFIMCRDCGFVLPCPNCDISLTLHMDNRKMKCHYCGHEEEIPSKCPVCASSKMRYYGTGTQKVEEELQEIFPEARILRMDVDTTRRKGAHEALLEKFGNHQADILLGTQMIAKGLDFPNVTLVGVLNADTALNLPDFRSAERTFQLLTQVSGRAGRAEKPGEVIIQTFNPTHYAIEFAKEQDFEGFYQKEMYMRHQGNYPPFFYTVKITASDEEENKAAKKMYEIVMELKDVLSPTSILLGPTPKAILRVNNRYFYQMVIKYKNEPALNEALKKILEDSQVAMRKGLKISIDVEPQQFI
ncbi:primosomal protein N' [Vagococcus sp. PNs007]|uniref:Replication restart protein PriA n=1 Tax=Vagococcus proximus TaxID=2991417 RepID=A0ABT5X3H8_9ENTE|nr:primosomal protein N' [Vagococcus proximus]MDF0480561.1 primosomal protein N' [Vagococcus proximus]